MKLTAEDMNFALLFEEETMSDQVVAVDVFGLEKSKPPIEIQVYNVGLCRAVNLR